MKLYLLIPLLFLTVVGCGGSSGSFNTANPAGTSSLSLATNIANSKAFLVSPVSSIANKRMKDESSNGSLYQLSTSGNLTTVMFTDTSTNEVVPVMISDSRKVDPTHLIVDASVEGDAKVLVIDATDGSVIDVSDYDSQSAQLHNQTLFAFKQDNSGLYQISLADGSSQLIEARLTEASSSFSSSLIQMVGNSFNVENPSEADPFFVDAADNIISTAFGLPWNQFFEASYESESSVYIQQTFYNKNNDLYTFTFGDNLQSEGDPTEQYENLSVESYNSNADFTVANAMIESNTYAWASKTPVFTESAYTTYDANRYLLFQEGFYTISEDNNGVVSTTWTDRPIAWGIGVSIPEAFSGIAYTDQNGNSWTVPQVSTQSAYLIPIISGDYAYWQSFNPNSDGTQADVAGIEIYRLKFDNSSAPELVVSDPNLINFTVANGVVIYQTTSGTYSITNPGETPILVSSSQLNPTDIIEITP